MPTSNGYLLSVYLVYGAVSVALILWLARTLYRNGAVFLEDVFDNKALAHAVNRLLVTGFYLLNLGFAFLLLRADHTPDAVAAVYVLVRKLGLLLLVLGVLHMTNMFVFYKIRRRAHEEPTLEENPDRLASTGPGGTWDQPR
jgi:hypothetical protein